MPAFVTLAPDSVVSVYRPEGMVSLNNSRIRHSSTRTLFARSLARVSNTMTMWSFFSSVALGRSAGRAAGTRSMLLRASKPVRISRRMGPLRITWRKNPRSLLRPGRGAVTEWGVEKFLGAGTSTLTVAGEALQIDARLLTDHAPTFTVPGQGTFSTAQVQTLRVLPGTFAFRGGPVHVVFSLSTLDQLDYDPHLDNQLSGRGSNLLTVFLLP